MEMHSNSRHEITVVLTLVASACAIQQRRAFLIYPEAIALIAVCHADEVTAPNEDDAAYNARN
jgi:hypothetical protein